MSRTQLLSTPTKCLSEDNESNASAAVIYDSSFEAFDVLPNLVITETGDPSNNDETPSNSVKIELDQSNADDFSETLHAKEHVNMNNINIEKISIYLDQQRIRHMHAQKILQKSIGTIEALEYIGSTQGSHELRSYIDELGQFLFNDKQTTRRIEEKFQKISSDYQSAMHELEILKDQNLKLIIIQTKLIEEKKEILDKCNEFYMPFCVAAENISGQLKAFSLKQALNTQKEEETFCEELQKIDIREKLISLKNIKLEKENLEKQMQKAKLDNEKFEKVKLEKGRLEKEMAKIKLEKEQLKKQMVNSFEKIARRIEAIDCRLKIICKRGIVVDDKKSNVKKSV